MSDSYGSNLELNFDSQINELRRKLCGNQCTNKFTNQYTNNNRNTDYNKSIYKIIEKNKTIKGYCKRQKIFILTILVQTIILSIINPSCSTSCVFTNIIIGIITLFISMYLGYYVHVLSHTINAKMLFLDLRNSNTFIGRQIRKLPIFLQFIMKNMFYFNDFHDTIHHNSKINKIWYNVIIEIIMNLCVEGVYLIIFLKIIDIFISIKGHKFRLNYSVIFAWSLLYTTIHHINYNIIEPICHMQHHKNKNTNYGLDFLDVMFDSKYNEYEEDMTYASINNIVILLFIIWIKKTSNKYYVIRMLKWLCNN